MPDGRTPAGVEAPTADHDTMALSLRDVSLSYTRADGTTLVAIDRLTLDVERGEFVCIVGPSGCGKTTLLYIISGLLAATGGEVLLDGAPISGTGRDRAMVFQNASLLPWRSVLDNVAFGLDLAKEPKAASRRRARELLEVVGLSGFEDQYPTTLSGGMQQRVNLARALAVDPEILLMDEPFASLDAQTREAMQSELLDVWATRRKTVLFVTHQTSEAVYLADRVVVLGARPGRIREDLRIDLPRPRPLEVKRQPDFTTYDTRLWQLLRHEAG